MTIKVVKQGKKPDEVVYEGTCHGCLSELEASREDLHLGGAAWGRGGCWWGLCPTCSKVTVFTPKGQQ